GGNDGKLSNGFENTVVTTEQAYTGLHSLKFDLPFTRAPHDAWVGTKRYLLNDVKAGDMVRISVWIMANNLVPDSAAKYPGTWSVGITPIFHSGYLPNDAYDEIGAKDLVFTFPNVTSFGWTKYYVDVQVPNDPKVKSLSVRLHPYSRFTGTIYFDEVTVEKLDIPQISGIGSFEGELPSYWTKGTEPSGSTLTWATDQYHSKTHSLKIEKSATSDVAKWESENMLDLWAPTLSKNVDIFIGAYVKTEGVNVNPANDDEKWMVSYLFYGQSGNLIGEVKLPIDQSVASSNGWIADTNAVGSAILPEDAYKLIIRFVGGKNATGKVWADDFMLLGRAGAWAGQNWNTSVEMPTGWNYWLPPNGGNDGKLSNGFENTVVTTEQAYTGLHSLKFDLPFTRAPHDAWVGTKRYLLNSGGTSNSKQDLGNGQLKDITSIMNAKPGDVLRISVWIMANNLVPDSAAKYSGTWSVGITPIFHSGYLPNDAYDEIGAKDLVFTFPNVTSFGWTKYYVDVTIPNDPKVKSLSVRLHPYARFTGTIYFDDVEVQVINTVTDVNNNNAVPVSYSLNQNYPNPFNPSTIISYSLPEAAIVTLMIYDVLGREVKTLVSEQQAAGTYRVNWNGDNNYGTKVASGVYIYRIVAGANFMQTKKMILLK
ncbi:MAG: T9SS type A sorting domain-containing protein, partial [Bacteroidetes bacterium]|nr:T9SS type A sorting domain-containing protein [Bacteroidota bacterium]